MKTIFRLSLMILVPALGGIIGWTSETLAQSCGAGGSQTCPGDTITTTTPATGGNPGSFGGVATVTGAQVAAPVSTDDNPSASPSASPSVGPSVTTTASAAASPSTTSSDPFAALTAQLNALNDNIKSTQTSIDNAPDVDSQLKLKQKMDGLLQDLNDLSNKIDAANQKAAALAPPTPPDASSPSPSPSPQPSPPANTSTDNSDLALWANLLNKKSSKQNQQNIKTKLDLLDAKNDIQDKAKQAADAAQKAADDLKKKVFGQ